VRRVTWVPGANRVGSGSERYPLLAKTVANPGIFVHPGDKPAIFAISPFRHFADPFSSEPQFRWR
jgi:hypothetical protein